MIDRIMCARTFVQNAGQVPVGLAILTLCVFHTWYSNLCLAKAKTFCPGPGGAHIDAS